MTSYVLRRLLLAVPTLIGITLIAFLIIHLAPGDPAALKAGDDASSPVTDQIIAETRRLYGLDQPYHVQYLSWLRRIATLDFGTSFKDGRPVWDRLKERIPVSLKLSGTALLLSVLLAIPVGVFSATRRGTRSESVLTTLLFALYSLPPFWVATLGVVFLGGGDFLRVFPVFGLQSMDAGMMSPLGRVLDQAWHLVLPVSCLAFTDIALLSRYVRSSLLEVVLQDYVRTARAKGLEDRRVIYGHALRNALIPMVTLVGSILPALIGGNVAIETIFSIPGMGELAFRAVLDRDYPVIMAVFTVTSVLTLAGILVADILYTFIDPRIRYERATA